jgi:hypothetical protein
MMPCVPRAIRIGAACRRLAALAAVRRSKELITADEKMDFGFRASGFIANAA